MRTLAYAMASITLALCLLPVEADAQPFDRPGTDFTATVASSDTLHLVLRADNGTLVTFPIEDPRAVPALVPGTRVTVRYERSDDGGYRLLGVRIAAGPIEPGATTDPPGGDAAEPQPPVEGRPPATAPGSAEATASPPPTTAPRHAAEPAEQPRAEPSTIPLSSPGSRPGGVAPLTRPEPSLRGILMLAVLMLVAGALLWVGLVER